MSAQLQEAPTTLQQRFAEALRHHKSGSLDEAERLYRQILALRPGHADSLHLLGVLKARPGSYGEAADLLRAAVDLQPLCDLAHRNLGLSLKALGRLDEALACYNRALELNPDCAQAHDSRGTLLMDLGRVDEAVACYRRVLELEPGYAAGHYNLGNALLSSGRVHEALAAYHSALELKPEFVEAYNNLGVALAELGRCGEALAAYDRAAGLQQPRFENPLANKASLLLETGQMRQSLRTIDQALAINPGSPGAWHIRSGLKKFEPGDPDIEAMEAVLADLPDCPAAAVRGPSLTDRIRLEFALGKAWMDVGEARRAFAHLDQGNRLQRSMFAYDSNATDCWIAEMAGSFSAELLKRLDEAGHPSQVPIFVVGMPRSGTTLIEQVLASHPGVYGAGELTLLEDMGARISGPASQLRPPGDPQRLSALLPEDLLRLGREYETAVCSAAPGRQRVVDKMPTNFLYVGFIHAILPNARIIHCRRDAVDTCLSCYTKLFRDVKFASDLRELGLYYRGYETLMSHWRNLLPPDRLLEVQYEDVVGHFEPEARRLLEFCGLSWHDSCLSFYENSRPVRTASVSQVRQPIYRSSVGRWKPYAPYLSPLLEVLGLKGSSNVEP